MPRSTADPDEQTLSEVFWSVARQLRRRSLESLAEWELNPSQARALGVLGRHGVMRLSELAEHLHIAARSTTEVVDALEQRGLLVRGPDPLDRRATLVSLTARGAQIEADIAAARTSGGETVFATLSEADRKRLKRILLALRTVET
jgi:DNA-binding MarR family transcriptional regulator